MRRPPVVQVAVPRRCGRDEGRAAVAGSGPSSMDRGIQKWSVRMFLALRDRGRTGSSPRRRPARPGGRGRVRPSTWPRRQTTILPAASRREGSVWQMASPPGGSPPAPPGSARRCPRVMVDARDGRAAPHRRCAGGATRAEVARSDVEAPTVVTHGPPWSAVPRPGRSCRPERFDRAPPAWIGVQERELDGVADTARCRRRSRS